LVDRAHENDTNTCNPYCPNSTLSVAQLLDRSDRYLYFVLESIVNWYGCLKIDIYQIERVQGRSHLGGPVNENKFQSVKNTDRLYRYLKKKKLTTKRKIFAFKARHKK
jgi:hypothetical protein